MYSVKTLDETKSKAKGINKSAIRNKIIKHENYVDTLNGIAQDTYPNTTIKSNNHNLETTITNKKTLCAQDTKRVFFTNEKSFALGHHKLYFT